MSIELGTTGHYLLTKGICSPKVFSMLISNYNHFATTNTIWSTIHNVTTGRMELHSNPVALTLILKSVQK